MKVSSRSKDWCNIVVGFVIGGFIIGGIMLACSQKAQGGWTGVINGVGTGWAGVHVESSTHYTNRATTLTNTGLPSAIIATNTTGYKTNAPLPSGAATITYSRIKGLAGGIWQAGS